MSHYVEPENSPKSGSFCAKMKKKNTKCIASIRHLAWVAAVSKKESKRSHWNWRSPFAPSERERLLKNAEKLTAGWFPKAAACQPLLVDNQGAAIKSPIYTLYGYYWSNFPFPSPNHPPVRGEVPVVALCMGAVILSYFFIELSTIASH